MTNARHSVSTLRVARVSLVGAGPGDPDLLTVRAVRRLAAADFVLYDRLVPGAIVDLAQRAIHECVGKLNPNHGLDQTAISRRLIEVARHYRRVVRLKGGDPFIFGRGGEEILALHAHRIPFEVIPGITAALGCASAVGIPLTHRGLAHQVTFVTAQRAGGEILWPTLAVRGQTVVFYMGVAEIPTIQQRLIQYGRTGGTPTALIENGSRQNQRVFVTTLNNLTDLARAVSLKAPSLIIVGEVVNVTTATALAAEAAPRLREHAA
ncbi:MAG: uroporphyrinogen-III C-methyltransferase [Gammaproteobacteria bacterium]